MPNRTATRPDPLTPEQRRLNMSRIRSKDTGPELILRRALHARGLRYRLHGRGLPGTPDLVFPARRAIVFIHGCFWHGHDCAKGVTPGTRQAFWSEKLSRNRARDDTTVRALLADDWRVITVWECALVGRGRLPISVVAQAVQDFLDQGVGCSEIRGSAA